MIKVVLSTGTSEIEKTVSPETTIRDFLEDNRVNPERMLLEVNDNGVTMDDLDQTVGEVAIDSVVVIAAMKNLSHA